MNSDSSLTNYASKNALELSFLSLIARMHVPEACGGDTHLERGPPSEGGFAVIFKFAGTFSAHNFCLKGEVCFYGPSQLVVHVVQALVQEMQLELAALRAREEEASTQLHKLQSPGPQEELP